MIDLGHVKKETSKKQNPHVPSRIQPDTLFTFTTELRWLISILKNKMLSPRYCEEDVRYLNVRSINKIAYPMKCFCDINLNKLDYHMQWYGNYGIAFEKEWGMKRDIQPVHYLNENSTLTKDISSVFKAMLKIKKEKETKTEIMLQDYLFHELMFYKPYQGRFKNRNTNKMSRKCFSDECEWRYVPDVTAIGYPLAILETDIKNIGSLVNYSNSMDGVKEVSLCFEYCEIKHIIIQSLDEYKELVEEIDTWGIGEQKYDILSKIIVWEQSREDF